MIRQITHQGIGGLKTITDDCLAQLKYDGAMYHLHIKNGRGYALTSKRVSVKTGELNERWDHFSDEFGYTILCKVKNETIFVCEAVAEHLAREADFSDFVWDRRVSFVAGIMNSKPEKVYLKYRCNPLRLIVFDVLYYDGKDVRDLPYGEKYKRFIQPNFPQAGAFGDDIELGDKLCYAVSNVSGAKTMVYFDKAVKQGLEGIVVKDRHSNNAMKIKKTATADCIIIGFTEGTGKYFEQIGAIEVGVINTDLKELPFRVDTNKLVKPQLKYLMENNLITKVGQASGMDDKMRHDMSVLKNAYMGMPVEIEYKEFTGSRMVHPRFKRLRFDKYITRCTMEQFEK